VEQGRCSYTFLSKVRECSLANATNEGASEDLAIAKTHAENTATQKLDAFTISENSASRQSEAYCRRLIPRGSDNPLPPGSMLQHALRRQAMKTRNRTRKAMSTMNTCASDRVGLK